MKRCSIHRRSLQIKLPQFQGQFQLPNRQTQRYKVVLLGRRVKMNEQFGYICPLSVFSGIVRLQNIFFIKGCPIHQYFKSFCYFSPEPVGLRRSAWVPTGTFSLSRYCMLRGKRGKTFLVQFAGPNVSIWDHKIL